MSINRSGLARRIFIMGRRLWPPARMRVSAPPCAFAITASSTLCAATKSNRDGNMIPPCSGRADAGKVSPYCSSAQRALGLEAELRAYAHVVVPGVDVARKRRGDRDASNPVLALSVNDLPNGLVAMQRAQGRKGVGGEDQRVTEAAGVGGDRRPRRGGSPLSDNVVDDARRDAWHVA